MGDGDAVAQLARAALYQHQAGLDGQALERVANRSATEGERLLDLIHSVPDAPDRLIVS